MIANLKRISIAFGLLAASALVPISARAQGPGPNANQALANTVAATLNASPSLAGQRVDVQAKAGTVTLSGTLSSPALKAEAIGRVKQVAGVTLIIDDLRVVEGAVQPAQYQVAMGGHGLGGHGDGGGNGMVGSPMNGNGGYANGSFPGGAMPEGAFINDGGPAPLGAAMGGGTQAAMPGAPNYAWPSTAPYPNFSAVGYPTVYPWQAWPNIGPFYPYPEVPLDWRAVTLRWDDGLWWLDFKKHYTRPFFTPYPFGIFGY